MGRRENGAISATPLKFNMVKLKNQPLEFRRVQSKKRHFQVHFFVVPSLKRTVRTEKWMVGIRLFPFGMAHFQGLC